MMQERSYSPSRDTALQLDSYYRTTKLVFVLAALAAFAVYWLSSFALVARNGTQHFHVDTWLYTELAEPNVFDRILPESQVARIFRFHPVTVVLAAG